MLLAGHAASLLAFLLGKPLPQSWPEFLLAVFLVTFQIVGLVRMSRWPVIVQTVMVLGNVAIQYATNPHWTDRYPIFGVFAVIIPLVAYLACTLPHWRKMNWALLGRSYRRAEDQAEIFA
ncbi:hypothetical protein [Caulobacter sp. Root1455]|uniref:hypothetical protein n=1 Tax=Caulobacter sp. Root1455 TaxID=1736465 RepID=UPI0012E349B2|nr:hypothetical protein [Caulobacter sp. Root1455]